MNVSFVRVKAETPVPIYCHPLCNYCHLSFRFLVSMLQHTQAEYGRNSILAAAPNTHSAIQLGRANVCQQKWIKHQHMHFFTQHYISLAC